MSPAATPDAARVVVWRVACGTGGDARAAALRAVLEPLLGGASFAIVHEAGGRPRLAPGQGPDLRFSLAQRGGHALVAVRLGHDVGVDYELPRHGLEVDELAQDHFDDHDREAFLADPDPDRDAAFLRAWTRHEAFVKACGAGLVAPRPADARERFRVRTLVLRGAFAAVASEGRDWTVVLRDEAGGTAFSGGAPPPAETRGPRRPPHRDA